MSHSIYTTKGFILSSSNIGEANKLFLVYTENFGLISIAGQGIRNITSKLKHHLIDYSFIELSLVRGKEIWRLTGVSQLNDSILESNIDILKMRARIFSLVKRLVQGEEKNENLFNVLKTLFSKDFDGKNIIDFEIDMLAKILSTLGYLEMEKLSDLNRAERVSLINKSIKESHL